MERKNDLLFPPSTASTNPGEKAKPGDKTNALDICNTTYFHSRTSRTSSVSTTDISSCSQNYQNSSFSSFNTTSRSLSNGGIDADDELDSGSVKIEVKKESSLMRGGTGAAVLSSKECLTQDTQKKLLRQPVMRRKRLAKDSMSSTYQDSFELKSCIGHENTAPAGLMYAIDANNYDGQTSVLFSKSFDQGYNLTLPTHDQNTNFDLPMRSQTAMSSYNSNAYDKYHQMNLSNCKLDLDIAINSLALTIEPLLRQQVFIDDQIGFSSHSGDYVSKQNQIRIHQQSKVQTNSITPSHLDSQDKRRPRHMYFDKIQRLGNMKQCSSSADHASYEDRSLQSFAKHTTSLNNDGMMTSIPTICYTHVDKEVAYDTGDESNIFPAGSNLYEKTKNATRSKTTKTYQTTSQGQVAKIRASNNSTTFTNSYHPRTNLLNTPSKYCGLVRASSENITDGTGADEVSNTSRSVANHRNQVGGGGKEKGKSAIGLLASPSRPILRRGSAQDMDDDVEWRSVAREMRQLNNDKKSFIHEKTTLSPPALRVEEVSIGSGSEENRSYSFNYSPFNDFESMSNTPTFIESRITPIYSSCSVTSLAVNASSISGSHSARRASRYNLNRAASRDAYLMVPGLSPVEREKHSMLGLCNRSLSSDNQDKAMDIVDVSSSSSSLYRLRQFTLNNKRIVQRSDSILPRSKASSICSGNSSFSHSDKSSIDQEDSTKWANTCKTLSKYSQSSSFSENSRMPPTTFLVNVIGWSGVGKTMLTNQFMSSNDVSETFMFNDCVDEDDEHLDMFTDDTKNYARKREYNSDDDQLESVLTHDNLQLMSSVSKFEDYGDKKNYVVSVLIDDVESELYFNEYTIKQDMKEFTDHYITSCQSSIMPQALLLVFSVTCQKSFSCAKCFLQLIMSSLNADPKMNNLMTVILVGNKTDLVRSRMVSNSEAKSFASSIGCKYSETSASLNHNVDELLVGLVTQIRLKLSIENSESSGNYQAQDNATSNKSPTSTNYSCSTTFQRRKSNIKFMNSHKFFNLIDKVLANVTKNRGGQSKSKSCDDLHVL